MKVHDLIAKLQAFHPDSDLKELDVLRLFIDDSVPRELDGKLERLKGYLVKGDLAGLREFVEAEKAAIKKGAGN